MILKTSTHQTVTVEMLNSILGVIDILEFDETHGAIDFLPKAHPLVSMASLEQSP